MRSHSRSSMSRSGSRSSFSRSSRSSSRSRSSFHSSARIGRSHISPHHSSTRGVHRHHGSIGVGHSPIYHSHIVHHSGYHYGHSRVSPLTILASFVFFFCAIAIFIGIMSINNSKDMLQEIRDSYAHYQSVIEYAEIHTKYQKTGEITGIYYNADYDKYCIKYKVNVEILDTFPDTINEYSFYIYDANEIKNFKVGDSILIACSSDNVRDTINMDYKNSPIEDDGEYAYYLGKSTNYTMIIISSMVVVAMIIILVVVNVNKKKKLAQAKANEANMTSNIPCCKYCGSRLPEGSSKCSECGASVWKQ